MIKAMAALTKTFANLVYPIHCASCKKPLDPLDKTGVCGHCASQIRPNPEPHCKLCGRSLENSGPLCAECKTAHFYFNSARSACLYEGVLRELIHKLKYKNGIRLGAFLASFMTEFLARNPEFVRDVDVVTFVPLDNGRLRERGFNQSKILAAGIGEYLSVSTVNTLDKITRTRRQSELSRNVRLSNLKNAFRIRKEAALRGKNILLIDDVMTTGSTLDECSRILAESGAGTIKCLTLARGI